MSQDPPPALEQWALSPALEHLNHGSYGGCPRAVIDAATAWRTRLEAAPMKFMVLEWQAALDAARAALASFIHAPADRLAFIPGATTGVAIALASAQLAAGDEILVTDHGYRACRNQVVRLAADRGLGIVTATLPQVFDAQAAVEAVLRAVTPRTRLVLLDHITSPTALILPLEQIVPVLAARGIQVLIDGAHAPGQLALDVSALLALGVTWYTGNNHKWVCAPKGTGFLVTSPAVSIPRPVVTSHGASPEYGPANRLHAELDWMGTHDPCAHLAVPTAIETVARMGGGWPQVRAHNHALVLEMRDRLAAALATPLLAPDASTGSMAALPISLPAGLSPFALQTQLLVDGWEIPIVDFARGPLVRVSAHLYNHAGQADALAAKLRALGVRGRPL